MIRLARIARWLRRIVWLALGALVALHVLLWINGSPQMIAQGYGAALQVQVETTADRLVGLAATLPATLLMAYGLYRLARMLRRFETADIFSVASIGHLRAFGLATLLSGVASLLESPLLAVLLDTDAGEIGHRFQVVIRGADLWTVLIGVLMFVIGDLMVEARRIAAENAEII